MQNDDEKLMQLLDDMADSGELQSHLEELARRGEVERRVTENSISYYDRGGGQLIFAHGGPGRQTTPVQTKDFGLGEDWCNCFIILEPAHVPFDNEVARLKRLVDNGKLPRPTVMSRQPNEADTDDLLTVFWVVLVGPKDNAGPEELWWRTQCAISKTVERLGLKETDERPKGRPEMIDKWVEQPARIYKLPDLADLFGAFELVYDSEKENWVERGQ